MGFLRNAWYAVAWSDEIAPGGQIRRKVLNEDLLIARRVGGEISVVRNRCPHRFAPLHLGQREGDVIECPYHGLRFDLSGKCLGNPHGDGTIPPRAVVQNYPAFEQHLLVWAWMGEADLADPAQIPEMIGLNPDKYAINNGYMYVEANYELMADNIMDLGHIEFLHKGLLGSEAVRKAEIDVSQDGTTVFSNRLTRGEILPPALEALYEAGGKPVDRWLDVTWHPASNMQLVVGVTLAGKPERIGREAPGVHLMTPETENTTHYFWSSARDFRREDHELHQALDQK
jgi:phenylpropionate dioxygenase-like ring-hydroxylating dioxygenase large terminal subunit